MDAEQVILTRLLPKTGQSAILRAGDDGTHQVGWWKGRLNITNRTRFLAKTIDGDDVVIDRATGLMWAADFNAAGCNSGNAITWNNGIDYANALDFAGFTDWRLPNVKELMSIMDFSVSDPPVDTAIFPNTGVGVQWASTSLFSATTKAWVVTFEDGRFAASLKTGTFYIRCVRG